MEKKPFIWKMAIISVIYIFFFPKMWKSVNMVLFLQENQF